MINHETEQLISFSDAAKLLPGRPSLNAIWRWRTSGIRGVKLESVLVGGRRWTSREALTRFIESSTAAGDGVQAPSRPNVQSVRNNDATQRLLRQAGLVQA